MNSTVLAQPMEVMIIRINMSEVGVVPLAPFDNSVAKNCDNSVADDGKHIHRQVKYAHLVLGPDSR